MQNGVSWERIALALFGCRVCRESGVALREVAPSWDSRHTWREAFVTSKSTSQLFLFPACLLTRKNPSDKGIVPPFFACEVTIWEAIFFKVYMSFSCQAIIHKTVHIYVFWETRSAFASVDVWSVADEPPPLGSIRILQPVAKIQMPTSRRFELAPWNVEGNSWEHLNLEVHVTVLISSSLSLDTPWNASGSTHTPFQFACAVCWLVFTH